MKSSVPPTSASPTFTTVTASDLEVDSGTLSVDESNNRVGVGTTSPGVQLEVQDTTTSSANTGGALRLSANDGAVMGDSHRLGVIEFTGAEDASNTQTVGARIEALTDASWTNVENGAALYFYTTDGDASQTNVLKLDSNKKATFTGAVQLSSTTTALTLQNTTSENTDGGCESKIIFEDHADAALGQIEVSHAGSSDDTKGKMVLSTHTGSSLVAALTIDESQVVTSSGPIAVAEGASFDISTPLLPTTDHTATGLTAQMLAGGPIGAFETVCIHTTTGEVVISDADAIATMPVIGIAPAAISDTDTGTILLQGFIRDDTWNWTLGGILYADNTTAGGMTQTAPSGTGDFVQAVGVALSADVVYFNPSLTLVEVA